MNFRKVISQRSQRRLVGRKNYIAGSHPAAWAFPVNSWGTADVVIGTDFVMLDIDLPPLDQEFVDRVAKDLSSMINKQLNNYLMHGSYTCRGFWPKHEKPVVRKEIYVDNSPMGVHIVT